MPRRKGLVQMPNTLNGHRMATAVLLNEDGRLDERQFIELTPGDNFDVYLADAWLYKMIVEQKRGCSGIIEDAQGELMKVVNF